MHDQFMLAALEQAWLGRGFCAPNPSVGAVAVHKGEIIAEAYHRGSGTAHAEAMIIEQLPPGFKGVSLYVSLEPCSHWGKTPPCVDAILKYGISKVIFGYYDPNPIVRERDSAQLLAEQGVDVLHYPLPEIDRFYQSYQHWIQTKKPWVTAKLAQSLDGKIAGIQGKPIQLTNAECAKFTHEQRLYTDIILTTAKTIQADNPLMNVRLPHQERAKSIAIIDSRLTLQGTEKIFANAQQCIIYYDENYSAAKQIRACFYQACPSKEGLIDLEFIIHNLGQRGFHDVWVEAGGTLFSALHQQKRVQRSYIYIAPTILGEGTALAYPQGPIFNEPRQISWVKKSDNIIACLDWQEGQCLPV